MKKARVGKKNVFSISMKPFLDKVDMAKLSCCFALSVRLLYFDIKKILIPQQHLEVTHCHPAKCITDGQESRNV